MNASTLTLPRDTSRQAEGHVLGLAVLHLNRMCGVVITAFVLCHVLAEAVLHVPALVGIKAAAGWLPVVQNQHWIHAILFFCIAFHTLFGFKLVACELGMRVDYRRSFFAIVAISALFGLRELARYAGL